jgi:hypothetical protein
VVVVGGADVLAAAGEDASGVVVAAGVGTEVVVGPEPSPHAAAINRNAAAIATTVRPAYVRSILDGRLPFMHPFHTIRSATKSAGAKP